MKRKLAAGLTGATLPIWVQDTSSTTGAGLGSLVFNTAGLVGEYRRQGQSAWTPITLATATLGTFTSGGWIADGSLAGAYEVGIPDAALATGARWVAIRYRGATNMLPVLIEIELDAVNYQDSVRFGLTGIPNAAAGASGGVYVIGGTGVSVATNSDKTGYSLTATTGLGNQTANITGNLSGSVGSVSGNVGGSVGSVVAAVTVGTINANVITAGSIATSALNGKGDWNIGKTGYALSSSGLDAITVETGLNARQSLSVIASSAAGVLAGAATATVTIAAANNSGTNRITATTDASGNRTAVTLSPPA